MNEIMRYRHNKEKLAAYDRSIRFLLDLTDFTKVTTKKLRKRNADRCVTYSAISMKTI
jgi:hypothetical protein